jgi:two-component system sensor histidine kinase YesM
MLFVSISSFLFNSYYKKDIMSVTNQYIDSLSANISFYIDNLEYATLLPYFNDDAMKAIKQSSTESDPTFSAKIDLEKKLDSLLSSTRYIKEDYYSALLVNDKNTLYSNSNNSENETIKNYNWSNEWWYKEAVADNGKTVFIPPHYPQYYTTDKPAKVFSVIRTIRNITTQKVYGVIKIDTLSTTLDNIFENVKLYVPNIIYITDEESNIFFMKNYNISVADYIQTEKIGSFNKIIQINENKVYSIKKQIKGTNLKLNILLDKKYIFLKSARIFLIGIFLYLIAFFVSAHFNNRFNKRIVEPVKEIKSVLKEVEQGNFNVNFIPNEKWELIEVGNAINNMIKELDITLKQKYIAEIKFKEEELKVLIAQIQPHFLFNTITSIIALSFENKKEELENSLFALSDLLRYVLNKQQEVTILEEFTFIEKYLLLQSNRFSDKFTYATAIDNSVIDFIIPKLIFQPFIENAIIHGIEPNIEKCHLNFFVSKVNDSIKILIEDNGVGFDSNSKISENSIGNKNSLQRLQIKYPDSDILITSKVKEGCKVIITINGGTSNENTSCR